MTALDLLGLSIIVVAGVLSAYHIGMRGVEQWDMSIFADGAYRIYHGQMPYRDFHIPIGPVVFYLVAGLCRLLGNFSWSTLILSNAIIGAAATIVVFFTLRRYLATLPSLLFAAAFTTTFCLPLSFPWHDVVAMLWATGAFATYLSAINAHESGRAREYSLIALAGMLTALCILTKQNIGGALFLTFSALLISLPFVEKESWQARAVRLLIYTGSCFLLSVATALYFQAQGSLIADLTVANNQMNRLAKLWNWLLFVDDQRFWWQPWRLDIKLLVLLAVVVPVVCYFQPISLRRWHLIGVAVACLAVTYFMRKTGVAAYQMYVVIVPLALGLLYAACLPTVRTIHLSSRRLLRLWYPGIALSVAFALAALGKQSAADTEKFLIAGRYSLSWSLMIVGATAFAGLMIWTLPGIKRRSEIILKNQTLNKYLAAARGGIVLITAGMGVVCFHVAATRQTWHPSYVTDLVPFQSIPSMKGVQAAPAVVRTVEDLAHWFEPSLKARPAATDGSQVFVYPSFQLLYSALGVQSFKGVTLWYDWKLSYSKEDCDTDVIESVKPRYIVSHEIEQTVYGVPEAQMIATAPRLKRYVSENYGVAYQNEMFTVFERQADLNARTSPDRLP